jgi:hypothetical protein
MITPLLSEHVQSLTIIINDEQSCASAVWSLLEILTLMVRMSSRQGVNPIAHLLIDFGLAGSNICAGVLLMPGAVQYDIGDHRAADFIAAWGGMSGMLYLLG